ncbi:hypothetical protein K0B96_10065 [Horticoccus luteus]|uniref:Uncharacterized protein n=1 Tax=Horticoccus luteus TaxID=2862869 RepID=A0A8F9TRH5_9BACT|nr:hypothetical protein [Horticoccus luteus]QYM77670.1 hypothetical protein K0B96_10065 [Horticoccus luteus]
MSTSVFDFNELSRTFHPRTGAMEAWNAAYARVEEYLRAHRIYNRLYATQLAVQILKRAALRHERNPARDPVVVAAEEMEETIEGWFRRFAAERELSHGGAAIPGRLALLLANAPERWPEVFLADEVPPELTQALTTMEIIAGPDMSVSSMVPQPIDLGPISDAAGDALEHFARWPLLRTVSLWLIFIVALAAAFHATR